ncbi:oxidoreductase [Umezawaea sp.]|uniref:oxidoreductase n=1 Tax=Umezawaea sp. TaxID=1955258 RepID=UPI002ED0918A
MDLKVKRIGYGAMQLAGPGVFGPPKDPEQARAVLRRAVELGVDHIDTSDYYGPYVVNDLIREALHPYPEDLVLVTKVGARRDDEGAWLPALSPDELRSAVHDNLRRLRVDAIDVVNFRVMDEGGSVQEGFSALADLQREGLIKHLGISNATMAQLAEARAIAPVVCVQNQYNLAQRGDEAMVEECAAQDIAYVPFFPLGGFQPLDLQHLEEVAKRHDATPRQVALAWLLHRSPTILLIPGTSSVAHLEENLAAGGLRLSEEDLAVF